jgi:hypothetical protein
MNRRSAFPRPLPLAPPAYDHEYVNQLVRVLNGINTDAATSGDLVGASLLLIGAPGSGYGLASGTAWVDGNGFLRLVRPGDVFAPGCFIKLSVGKVTVTTT